MGETSKTIISISVTNLAVYKGNFTSLDGLANK